MHVSETFVFFSRVCTDKKRELLSLLEKLGHTAVLQDLSKHGVDILDFKDMISSRLVRSLGGSRLLPVFNDPELKS